MDVPQPRAALYALRVLLEPLGFQLVNYAGGGFADLSAHDSIVCSYGSTLPNLSACSHLHILPQMRFWTSLGRAESLPPRPFRWVQKSELGLHPSDDEAIALPFVADSTEACSQLFDFTPGKSPRLVVRADVVASAFYFLTRYEETFIEERDRWGRVPEEDLSIVQEGLADRAPVDEYREVLAGWLGRLLGRFVAPHPPGYEIFLTHDVDSGFRVTRGPFWSHVLRGIARDLVRYRSPRTAFELASNAVAVHLGRPIPFGGVSDILELAERHGLTSHFFFMANGSHPDDAAYDIHEAAPILRAIRDRGHRVGLHVGINAACSSSALQREWDLLTQVLGRLPEGARTHFLRFDPARTPLLLDAVGARFDSSAAFSNRCGFRTGTTRPHRLFDLSAMRPLDLVEYPLVIMDKGIYHLPRDARHDAITRVISAVRRHGGCLTINWHYWYFTHRYRKICEELLAACKDGRDVALFPPS